MIRRRRIAAALLLAGATLWLSKPVGLVRRADAQTTPDIGLAPIASGLGSITAITNARDARLFVVLQSGKVRIYSNGTLLATPFLDVSSLVSCCGEQGLLSLAFHPLYDTNRYFFIYYTNTSGNIEIARYQRMLSDPNRADTSTRVVLLTIPHPVNTNHNGGQLQFGPADGYLYLGTGDGGSGNDPPCNAQNDAVPLGKMLRIDVNQNVNTPPYYGVPPSNPFPTQPFPKNITWAKGMRNPFRFSFDRATGDLWIGDVGQDAMEEVDFQPQGLAGGRNYGWKVMEGTLCGGDDRNGCSPLPPACNDPSYTAPIYTYDHSQGCAIIGGYVYRGSQDRLLYGRYLYGDLCSGNLWSNGQLFTPTLGNLQTWGEDAAGELYLGTGGGALYRITHPASPPPTPTPAPLKAYTLAPCRVFDTRSPVGLYGGPPVGASSQRTFVLAGRCGIPPTAKAVSVNVTVTEAATAGDLRLFAGGGPLPAASVINYGTGQTRANNAVVALGPLGEISLRCDQLGGNTQVILDVNGYFQ